MYPILFQIEGFQLFGFEVGLISLFSHGVFQALGFLIAALWFLKIAQKKHLHLEFIADHFFSLIIWSIIGARLGYVYVFFARYEQNPLSMLYFWAIAALAVARASGDPRALALAPLGFVRAFARAAGSLAGGLDLLLSRARHPAPRAGS